MIRNRAFPVVGTLLSSVNTTGAPGICPLENCPAEKIVVGLPTEIEDSWYGLVVVPGANTSNLCDPPPIDRYDIACPNPIPVCTDFPSTCRSTFPVPGRAVAA